MLKKLLKVCGFLGIFAGLVYGATIIVLPKIPDFYQEKEWDVLFFGTSQSYCTFSPSVFDEYGLNSYNRSRQQQPINYTYYYIKDALDVSDVKVVVLETYALAYWDGHEAFRDGSVRDSSLNDMRYSPIKYEAILDCVEKEKQIGYLFPLDKYHSNWEKLNYSSLSAFWENITKKYYKEESDRGFYDWGAVQECTYASDEELNNQVRRDIYGLNLKYLDLILKECKENGTKLVLTRSPLPCDAYIIESMNTIEDWAKEHEVDFINYMDLTKEVGLDWKQDSLDGGTHLNTYGAKKVSSHLAEYLKDRYF